MQTYARQGGTSSIFVHDDGMQLLSEAERQERINFYADNGIGWVARPKHDSSPGGFQRRGRFKKASNMNYGLALSLRLEHWIHELETHTEVSARSRDPSEAGDHDEEELEEKALKIAIEEIYEESGKKFKPWASNAKALRMGAIILIVDSDTIVPEVRLVYHVDMFDIRLTIHVKFRIVSVTLRENLPSLRRSLSFSTNQV